MKQAGGVGKRVCWGRSTMFAPKGGVWERGYRDRALTKWQSEDQSGLRNRAAKRPDQKKKVPLDTHLKMTRVSLR